ncbi:MAG: hypothetical protein EXR83_06620 [Gammaproteobacteria bacterium]|nr:hypothetical protein [Gammaproteobacteria bacterium]
MAPGLTVVAGDSADCNDVGVAVRDMAKAAPVLEGLGCDLTPPSAHTGAWKPGEPVNALGSANRGAMFASNYLEVLTHANPAQPDPRQTAFRPHHQGAHSICVGTGDTHAVGRLAAAGIKTSGAFRCSVTATLLKGRARRNSSSCNSTRRAKYRRHQC